MIRVIIVYSLGKPDNHQPDSKHMEFTTATVLRADGHSFPHYLQPASASPPISMADNTHRKEGAWFLHVFPLSLIFMASSTLLASVPALSARFEVWGSPNPARH